MILKKIPNLCLGFSMALKRENKMNPSKMMNIFSCLMEKDAFMRGFFTLLLMKPWEVVFKMNRKCGNDGKID